MDIDEKFKICKVKKQVCKGDLLIVSVIFFFDQGVKVQFFEKEFVMVMEDKFVVDIEEKKNEFEIYIYDFCNKFDDQYFEFVSDEEKEKIKVKFEVIEVCFGYLVQV